MSAEREAFEAALKNLPDRRPRPPEELAALEAVWEQPTGWRVVTSVNNNVIGPLFIGTALLFFVLAGTLALLMRLQLLMPLNTVLGQQAYNQFFTMHGTVMMFLFAVPVVEAMGVLLLPQMVGAREFPFPRLSAFAYWTYAIGGLVFFSTVFYGAAPDGGWFMYPPLTGLKYSPGVNSDWWLLGIGFIEISAIAGAIEIIVGVLKTRAPGMTLDKLPIFAWAMLAFAGMIVIGFPAVILCTILLELERAFDWPFFIPERGGDPLVWQHLFWFFGHPEVYIIFIPGAGMISMLVSVVARRALVGHRLVVLAIIATSFLSFGVWVHHMFATGLPDISVSFFSAASMAVSIPAGIQIFSYIATLAAAKKLRLGVPGLFIVGFLIIFTMGGLTGVMLAMVPFDWQAHDTYFVVAHLHYVLIGGMVFPLIGGIYYWTATSSSRPLSETLGRWSFWLLFVGMHTTFLIQHWTGFMGMPRRVYTYLPEQGLTLVNVISTIGAFAFAAGVAVFLFDLAKNFRVGNGAGNPYDGGTLEWLPNGNYAGRSIPLVTSRNPLWDQPGIADEVEKGQWFLPGTMTGQRETMITSPVSATPQYVMLVATDGWAPLLAAIGVAGFFLLLTVKFVWLAFAFGLFGVGSMFVWMKGADQGHLRGPGDVGGGLMLPFYMTGLRSHAIWAVAVLAMVLAMKAGSGVFGYLILWSGRPDAWPPAGIGNPGLELLVPLGLYVASFGALWRMSTRLDHRRPRELWLGAAALLLLAAFVSEILVWGRANIWPTESSYGATVYSFTVLNGELVSALLVTSLFLFLKSRRDEISSVRCLSVQATAFLWGYLVVQAGMLLGLVGLFPLVTL